MPEQKTKNNGFTATSRIYNYDGNARGVSRKDYSWQMYIHLYVSESFWIDPNEILFRKMYLHSKDFYSIILVGRPMNIIGKQKDFPFTHTASLSERICREIESQIRMGTLEPGERLPSESKYARILGVSRNSYREALSLLEKSALVVRRQGIGTFVTESKPLIQGGIESLKSVVQMIASQGLKPESTIIAFRKSQSERTIEEKLNLEPQKPILYLETLKMANDWPVAVCIDIIPSEYLHEKVDPNELNDSIFEGLQEYHQINIRFAECDIIPIVADAELAQKLRIEQGSPVLLLSQIHFDETDRRVLFSKSYFPFNRFTFKLMRRR